MPDAGPEEPSIHTSVCSASCRRNDLLDLLTDRLIAFAGACLETCPVDDLNLSAMIADETGLLQHMRHHRHGGAAHTQHLREEFMGKPDLLLSSRSRACSSQRLSRASTACSALQAAVCCTWISSISP